MPSDAKALNNENTLWARKDAENNYYFETTASKIVATKMQRAFYYLQNVESYTGLDKLDVSDVSTFESCFKENRYALASLDLSSWQINPAASTEQMFMYCRSLSNLTLNNTFHSGSYMFSAVANASGSCTVYGVTDANVKNNLKTDTEWNATKMHFDGE